MTTDRTGFASAADMGDDFAQLSFMVTQLINGTATATLVRVVGVQVSGDVAQASFVDCQPLVQQTDGAGKAVDHAPMFNVPFFRLQGGAGAILLDPEVGDVGLAVFASHDISRVKNTVAAGPPGSPRRFDMSDGLYLGGFRNAAPTQYIRFTNAGIEIVAPLVSVSGNLSVETGADCSFATGDGGTVTVRGGIITAVTRAGA